MQAASQPDEGNEASAGGGQAQATFADVDKAGRVRNALKFKYPTKQVLLRLAVTGFEVYTISRLHCC